MNAQGINWDDYQYFLTVAELGGLSPAARRLGVTHSTVLRRLRGLEKSLGVRLFERGRYGYRLTAAGEEIVADAGAMRETADRIARQIQGRDIALSGTVRLTTVDTLAEFIVADAIPELVSRYPGIQLEVAVQARIISLTRREADIALRPAHDPPDTMIGRKLADVAIAVYGAVNQGLPPDLDEWPLVAGDEAFGQVHSMARFHSLIERRPVVARTTSFPALAALARAGVGAAPLPCYIGDADPLLMRVTSPLAATPVWLLTHPDLRDSARVRAVRDWLSEAVRVRRALIEGHAVDG